MYYFFKMCFHSASFIIPMPASKYRLRQPVTEIAKELARLMNIPCFDSLLIKTSATSAMKDIATREEKVSTLVNAFVVNDILAAGLYDVLIVDDLYDTGSSLEAATRVLRRYAKIRNIYVVTVTRRK